MPLGQENPLDKPRININILCPIALKKNREIKTRKFSFPGPIPSCSFKKPMPVLFNNCLALLNRIATPKKQQVFCELIFQKKKRLLTSY